MHVSAHTYCGADQKTHYTIFTKKNRSWSCRSRLRCETCFTTQTRPARPRPIFWSETGLVLRPAVSDHIAASLLGQIGYSSSRYFQKSFSALCYSYRHCYRIYTDGSKTGDRVYVVTEIKLNSFDSSNIASIFRLSSSARHKRCSPLKGEQFCNLFRLDFESPSS